MAEPASGGRWRLAAGFALLVALMVLAVVAWFVFQDDGDGRVAQDGQSAPIVRAPDGPDRERPEDPGGVEIPDRDKQVYDTFKPADERTGEAVERLLPAAEAPLAEPEPAPKPDAAEEAPAAAAADDGGDLDTVVVEDRAEHVIDEGAADAPAADEDGSAPAPPPARPAGVRAEAEAAPAAKPAPAPEKAAAPKPAEGPWQVQLAALRAEADAMATWKRISGKHAKLLDGMQPAVTRADTSNGVFYRLRVGGFASRGEADAFCARLKAAGQDCIAARR